MMQGQDDKYGGGGGNGYNNNNQGANGSKVDMMRSIPVYTKK